MPSSLSDAVIMAQRFIAQPLRHYIGGQWINGASGPVIPVINPATEEVIAALPAATDAEVYSAVQAARQAFDTGPWRTMPAAERERLLLILADRIEANADEIAAIETLDNGMPFIGARHGAINAAISSIRYNAGWVRRLGGVTVPVSVPGEWHGYTTREPHGVAALIVPWNAPFAITCTKLSSALAAGCTVVLKPAELTSLSTLRLMEIIDEIGFPAGVVNMVTGYGAGAGAALVRHPGVDKLSFTGSTVTGQSILRETVGALKRVSLELGGKSPVIVFSDADLTRAIPAVAMGIFGNSGQICAAGSRLFIHDSIFDAFIDGLVAFTRKLVVGDGFEAGVNLGPVISQRQLDRILGYIESGKAAGARLVTGGKRLDRKGYFVEPTIFVETRPDMQIVREEIFGPVLSIMRFKDETLDQIATLANDTIYGLSAVIWTRDLRTAHMMSSKIKAGSVKVNGSGMEFALPFGGFKQSGIGRENGREGVESYTELKSVMMSLL